MVYPFGADEQLNVCVTSSFTTPVGTHTAEHCLPSPTYSLLLALRLGGCDLRCQLADGFAAVGGQAVLVGLELAYGATAAVLLLKRARLLQNNMGQRQVRVGGQRGSDWWYVYPGYMHISRVGAQ